MLIIVGTLTLVSIVIELLRNENNYIKRSLKDILISC